MNRWVSSNPRFTWTVLLIAQFLVMTDEHRFFVDGFVHAPWLAAGLLLVMLIWSLFNSNAEAPVQMMDTKLNGTHRAAFLLMGLICIRYWHFQHVLVMNSLPIDSKYADMLPLLKAGFADLDRFETPYRPHDVPWKLTNYYLPSTFIPYYVVEKLSLDIRWVNVWSLDLIGFILLWFCDRLATSSGKQALFGGLLLINMFNLSTDRYQFVRIIHLGPFWLYSSLVGVGLVLRISWMTIAGSVLAITARETSLFFLVPMMTSLSKRNVAVIILLAGLIFMPFAATNMNFYAGNLAQYSSLGWLLDHENYRFKFVGMAGPLHALGLDAWRIPLFAMLFCAVLWRTHRGRNFDSTAWFVWCGAVLSVGHSLFALVSWNYLYFEGMLLLGIAAIASLVSHKRVPNGN